MKTKPKSCKRKNIFISKETKIGKNVKISQNNKILGRCIIEDNCIIKQNNTIENCTILQSCEVEDSKITNSKIAQNCKIEKSVIDGANISKNAQIGVFARIRPQSFIGQNVKIGNFVEVKNSTIKSNSKVSHLAYVGDAEIGKNCNIGCGVVFVNFDGKNKHKTKIGDNCFIGSNSNLVAPLNLAQNTFVACGSTVTKDTNEWDFIIARSREIVKPNYAKKYIQNIKK